jgi:hypothetical protein
MDPRLFTAVEAWYGGFYELALEIGSRSDDRLQSALTALWKHPDLDGCYLDRSCEPSEQPRTSEFGLASGTHLLGLASLPNGSRVACGSCLIREDDGPDWLDFYLPSGSLGTAYPIGPYPFGAEPDWHGPWQYEVEDWLADIGLWIARSALFDLGLIGFEVSGQLYAAEIAEKGIPDERRIGYLWPVKDSVVYYRRTVS